MYNKVAPIEIQYALENDAITAAIENEKQCIHNLELIPELLGDLGNEDRLSVMKNMTKTASQMLLAHKNLKKELEKSCCSVASAYLLFMQNIHAYLDYCCYLKRARIMKITELEELKKQPDFTDILNAPVTHIGRYENILCDLCQVLPESEGKIINGICEAMQKTIAEMENIFSSIENALKVLWIQKCLVKSEPKIFTAGRILLKEGSLMKVNQSSRGVCQREFFLFTDILLCCKGKQSSSGTYKKSSLKCCSVIPLRSCSVRSILTSRFEGEELFKVMWDDNMYVLFSKTIGVSQLWIKEIQSAIRNCKERLSSNYTSNLLTKNCALKRSTVVMKRPGFPRESSQSEINSSAFSTGEAQTDHPLKNYLPFAALGKLVGL